MYQIYSINPGFVHLPNVKHGEMFEVCCGLDETYHSAINVMACELGKPIPEHADEVTLGFYNKDDKLMTFSYKHTHRVSKPNLDTTGWDIFLGVIIALNDGSVPRVFEQTTMKRLYNSPGVE